MPSAQNPADLASRGSDTQVLINSKLWWNGPLWLQSSVESWPPSLNQSEITHEEKRNKTLISQVSTQVQDEHIISTLISHCSTWVKLLRVLAMVRRFLTPKRLWSQDHEWLTASELQKSVVCVVKYVQSVAFAFEIQALALGKNVAKNSSIASLNPSLDDLGLLRMQGRVQDHRNPVIIPNGDIARLLVEQIHKNNLHSGIKLTLYLLRCSYWVLNARSIVKRVIHSCISCVRFKARTSTQTNGRSATLPNSTQSSLCPYRTGLRWALFCTSEHGSGK